MTPALNLLLDRQQKGWTWTIRLGENELDRGETPDGDTALSVGLNRISEHLDAGLETELCSEHWRQSSIRLRPSGKIAG